MHRILRLLLFVVMGIIPLSLLTAWGILRHTDIYRRWECDRLAEVLNMPVSVRRFHYLRPNKTRLEDVTVFGNAGVPIIQTPEILVLQQMRDADTEEPVRRIQLTLPELTLDAGCLVPLWELHKRILTQRDIHGLAEIEILVTGPVRVGKNHPLELKDARLRLYPTKNGHQTDISFLLREETPPKMSPVTLNLRLAPQSAASEPAILATLQADENHGIPTELLRALFPPLEKLGGHGRFFGEIILQHTFRGWSGMFRGRFTEIDISRRAGNITLLTGTATLELKDAAFSGGQLVRAAGTFRALDGVIHRGLLDRIISVTSLTTRGIPLDMTATIPYTEFAFGFHLENGIIQIDGACRGFGRGIFLTGRNGPILCESSNEPRRIPAAVFFDAMK